MSSLNFEVMPRDTFLFRDTMSMEKGTTNFIESMAMPYPSVVYGMLTTALMREGCLADLKNSLSRKKYSNVAMQAASERERFLKENLQLNQFFLTYDGELYIPAPLDLFVDRERRTYQGEYQDGLLYSPESPRGKLECANGLFMRFSEFMNQYQQGQISGISLKEESYFWGDYTKAGIEIDKKIRSVRKGNLYFARMREARESTGYFAQAEIRDRTFDLKDWRADVLLGGRNRTAYFKQLPDKDYRVSQLETYKKGKIESPLLKMIFTTPYLLESEDQINESLKEKEIFVKASVTGKPQILGGFDMASGKRKKLQTALPAGSLYLIYSDDFKGQTFEAVEKELTKLLESPHNQSFRGFGRFVLAEER